MALLDRLLGRSKLYKSYPGRPLSETPGVLFAGNQSAAGIDVTADKALSLSAVFAAVNTLSRIYASLPLVVMRQEGRNREPATSHPAYRVLKVQFNWEMTSSVARRAMEWNRRLGGNAYAEIVWAGNGKPVAVYPLEYWRVAPRREDDGTLYYLVDGQRRVEVEDMLHVPLVSTDGVCGRSWLDWAVDSLGLGISAQTFASKLFANMGKPGGILRHPTTPAKAARDEFRESWERNHGSSENAGKTAVLWGGWEYTGEDGTIAPEQAQLIESRRFDVEEVSRWIGVPPFILSVLASAGTVEQQAIQFLVFSLGPDLVDYEQEYDRKILQPPNVYAKHNVGGLLRGDMAAQSAFFREMVSIGVFSTNDCRELLDRNPVEGGDVHFFPMNMIPLSQAGQVVSSTPPAETAPIAPAAPAPSGQPAPEGQPNLSALVEHTLGRLARVEAVGVRRAVGKPGRFLDWIDDFYPAHETRLQLALQPLLSTSETIAAEWCRRSRADLLEASDGSPDGFAQRIEDLVRAWQLRPGEIANVANNASNP